MQVRFLSAAYGDLMNRETDNKIIRFIQDNIKLVAPLFLIVLTALVTYISLSARDTRLNDPALLGAAAGLVGETEGDGGDTPVEEVSVPVVLSENTDQSLLDFFYSYYQCLSNGDVETLETMVDSLDIMDKLVKVEQAGYLEYEITNIYTLPGYDESSLIAFVVSKVTFDMYPEDPLPSYDGFYLKKSADGSYLIINSEPGAEESEHIAQVLACDDVVELGNRITTEYNDIITASPALLTYMKELDSIVSLEAGEKLAAINAGEEVQLPEIEVSDAVEEDGEVKMATANSSVNVRVSDSMNADTMGQLRGGQSVEVTEVRGNGWSQINFDGKVGYVKSEYLTLDIDVDSVVTIGTVTATETLNIRATASTDGMVMGSFAKGTTARLVEEKDGWCEVIYNNKVCYLSSQYLEIELD